jgi:hypothetical protein
MSKDLIPNEKQLVKGIVTAQNRLFRSSIRKDKAISDFKVLCVSNGLDPDLIASELRKNKTSSAEIQINDYVYLISAGDYLKIGKTSGESPISRMNALQTANPVKLKMEAYFVGGIKEEKELHKRFKHLHARGEWFKFDMELREFVLAISGEVA